MRAGILLTRQTMSNWLLKATELWLKPIYQALHSELRARHVLHRTNCRYRCCTSRGNRPPARATCGCTARAVTPTGRLSYEYQPTRAAEHPQKFLESFTGCLHFVLGFPYEMEKRCARMQKEDSEYAEMIYDELITDGVDQADRLSETEFRELMQAQYADAMQGVW